MKKSFHYISLLLIALIMGCQTEDFPSPDVSIREKAKSWYEQEHSPKLNENPSFYGNPDWGKLFQVEDKLYFPLISQPKTGKSHGKLNSKINTVYAKSYLVLNKKGGNNFEESLKVFVSSDSSNFKSNSHNFELSFLEYNSDNKIIEYLSTEGISTSIVNPIDEGRIILKSEEDCTTYNVVQTDYYSDGSIVRSIIFSYEVCIRSGGGSSGFDDGNSGSGSGGPGDPSLNDEYPYPHCSSFEYYKPPGSSLTAAAVIGLNNTFVAPSTMTGNPSIRFVYVAEPTPVYFTMPSFWQNGQAATATASALNDAINATAAWFLVNSNVSQYELGQHWREEIKKKMNNIGGQMSLIPPFQMSNPAPYQVSLFTTGNCN